MAARAARRLPHRRNRHLFRTTVLLASPIGRRVGLSRRRLGAASMAARAALRRSLHLFPTIALLASPIGRRVGLRRRRHGAASTRARAAQRCRAQRPVDSSHLQGWDASAALANMIAIFGCVYFPALL